MVVDSSAWIDWLTDGSLSQQLAKKIPERSACLVPTIVQHELAKWLIREKGEDIADEVIAYTQTCRVIALDTPLALEAAEVARLHKLATADAIVYATARRHGAELLTCDAHFKGLPNVILIAKRN